MSAQSWFTLLRKDWHVYRAPVAAALILGLLPWGVGTGLALLGECYDFAVSYGTSRFQPSLIRPTGHEATQELYALVCIAAAFGGLAFAAERRDRTAGFLSTLPLSRRAVVGSKLTVAIVCLSAAFAAYSATLRAADRQTGDYYRRVADVWVSGQVGRTFTSAAAHDRAVAAAVAEMGRADRDLLTTVACTAVAAFGLAWALSSLLPSPAIATTTALVTVAAAGVVLTGVDAVDAVVRASPFTSVRQTVSGVGLIDRSWRVLVWDVSAVVTGAASVVAGVVVYARRVEP